MFEKKYSSVCFLKREIKDQGFTRPKILILLPFRHSVIQVVDLFIALCPKSQQEQILNKKKFYQEFGLEEEDVPPVNRPEEYAKIFEGNVDDYFRIGISFSRKAIKLYSEFYSSDLIIASPLGLRLAMGEPKSKKFDCDFLSSIEIMILDQTDIFLMQNWDHLNFIFDYLNTIPKKPRNTDFSRVKEWYLNGWAKYYRQTIICSSFITPELNNLWNRNCTSMKGAFKIRPLSYQNGSIQQVIPKIRQMFFKFDCNDPAQLDDIRFKYFVEKVFFHQFFFYFKRVLNHSLTKKF